MPDNYSGNAANVTSPLGPVTINGSASGAGGAVVLSTTTAHDFASNDLVTVAGVGGTTEADGTWVILVIDATHFLLVGTTWVHAWTSGGTATDESLTPYFQVPKDGETPTVESILASIKALADRTQFLQKQFFQATEPFLVPSGQYVVSSQDEPATSSYGFAVAAYATTTASGSGPSLLGSVVGCEVGDIIEVVAHGAWSKTQTGNGFSSNARLEFVQSYSGGIGQTTSPIPHSETSDTLAGALAGFLVPVSMVGRFTVTVAGTIAVFVNGFVGDATVITAWQPTLGNSLIKQYRAFA